MTYLVGKDIPAKKNGPVRKDGKYLCLSQDSFKRLLVRPGLDMCLSQDSFKRLLVCPGLDRKIHLYVRHVGWKAQANAVTNKAQEIRENEVIRHRLR